MSQVRPKITPKDINLFRALVFDMDGTLINSEPLHMEAIIKVLQRRGINPDFMTPEFCHQSVGKADKDLLHEVFPTWSEQEVAAFIEEKSQTLLEILESKTTDDLKHLITPGVEDFLKAKSQIGFPKLFLMTASEAPVVAPLLKKAGLYDYFNEVFSRECTARTKPSASPYLFLMRRHQLKSDHTLIFEDSPTGLRAAQESGARVIRISAHCAQPEMPQFHHLQSCDNLLWLC